ncbi:MAG: hypothetical protein FWC78_03560 [Defluviitaleaceae bacterium]|nr:hypothetical protein [Defluviitaleaceae bacterium]
MIWQPAAAKKISTLLAGMLAIDEIKLGGSLKTPAELDKYSDVDIEIFLPGDKPVCIKTVLAAVAEEFSPVFGYEIIAHARKDVIRLCLEDGKRFDLLFRYPVDKQPQPEANETDMMVNQFWFMAAMVLAKLGRRDNLIAAHLALEICQIIIVMQMLQRDRQKGTNIHRFGDDEAVPVLDIPPLVGDNRERILAIVFSAAACMDAAAVELGYGQKSEILRGMLI